MGKEKKQNLMQGAAILLFSMIIVKIVGAIFKLPLGNILMESGMAYFNAAYNLFTAIYALTVTGLTTAVARMVATFAAQHRYRDCKHVLHVSRRIFILCGIIGMLVMFIGARWFANASELPKATLAIMFMSPAIFFSCMMATYRGYYEGLRNMIPSAVSEVVEVLAKLMMGLLFTYLVLMLGQNSYQATGTVFGQSVAVGASAQETAENVMNELLPFAAAGAMVGVSFSTFAGFLYMFLRYKMSGSGFTKEEYEASPEPSFTREITMTLIRTAIPITISAVVTNLVSLIDLFTCMNRLNEAIAKNPEYFQRVYGKYLSSGEDMATYIYGGYTMENPIYNLVPAFTALFGKSALPNVTEAWVNRNRRMLKTNIESVVRMTSLISFPCGIGFIVMGPQIAQLIYPSVQGAALSVGVPLQYIGFAAIFVGMVSPMYAILQSTGRFDLPVKFTLIGAVVKIVTNYFLVAIPQINIGGASIGSTLCNALILILCMEYTKRITGIRFRFLGICMRNMAAALLCGAVAFGLSRLLTSNLGSIVSIACAGIAYVIGLLIFRAINEDDVLMLPKGKKLAATLNRYHLLSRSGKE